MIRAALYLILLVLVSSLWLTGCTPPRAVSCVVIETGEALPCDLDIVVFAP